MRKVKTTKPIREGCYIEWQGKTKILSGVVVSHTYTNDGHVFTIEFKNGNLHNFNGSSLYRRLIYHRPGLESKKDQKKERKLRRHYEKKINRKVKRTRKFKRPKKVRKPKGE